MMTFNIKVDLDNPSTSKFEVPSNMPYAVRLELYKGGLAHAAWDGDYGVGNVIPTAQSYEAKFSANKWINSADAWKDGFFGEEEGAVTVDSEFPNIVTLNCAARAEGSDGVKLIINPTEENWDAIPSESAITDGDADPRIASRIEIVFNYVSKEGCKPAAGGGGGEGGIPDPEEKEEGQYLKFNGEEWIADDVDVPTKVSDLENDSGYQTESEVAEAIEDAIEGQDTITMSGTYEDDTEFEFTIVGKASE